MSKKLLLAQRIKQLHETAKSAGRPDSRFMAAMRSALFDDEPAIPKEIKAYLAYLKIEDIEGWFKEARDESTDVGKTLMVLKQGYVAKGSLYNKDTKLMIDNLSQENTVFLKELLEAAYNVPFWLPRNAHEHPEFQEDKVSEWAQKLVNACAGAYRKSGVDTDLKQSVPDFALLADKLPEHLESLSHAMPESEVQSKVVITPPEYYDTGVHRTHFGVALELGFFDNVTRGRESDEGLSYYESLFGYNKLREICSRMYDMVQERDNVEFTDEYEDSILGKSASYFRSGYTMRNMARASNIPEYWIVQVVMHAVSIKCMGLDVEKYAKDLVSIRKFLSREPVKLCTGLRAAKDLVLDDREYQLVNILLEAKDASTLGDNIATYLKTNKLYNSFEPRFSLLPSLYEILKIEVERIDQIMFCKNRTMTQRLYYYFSNACSESAKMLPKWKFHPFISHNKFFASYIAQIRKGFTFEEYTDEKVGYFTKRVKVPEPSSRLSTHYDVYKKFVENFTITYESKIYPDLRKPEGYWHFDPKRAVATQGLSGDMDIRTKTYVVSIFNKIMTHNTQPPDVGEGDTLSPELQKWGKDIVAFFAVPENKILLKSDPDVAAASAFLDNIGYSLLQEDLENIEGDIYKTDGVSVFASLLQNAKSLNLYKYYAYLVKVANCESPAISYRKLRDWGDRTISDYKICRTFATNESDLLDFGSDMLSLRRSLGLKITLDTAKTAPADMIVYGYLRDFDSSTFVDNVINNLDEKSVGWWNPVSTFQSSLTADLLKYLGNVLEARNEGKPLSAKNTAVNSRYPMLKYNKKFVDWTKAASKPLKSKYYFFTEKDEYSGDIANIRKLLKAFFDAQITANIPEEVLPNLDNKDRAKITKDITNYTTGGSMPSLPKSQLATYRKDKGAFKVEKFDAKSDTYVTKTTIYTKKDASGVTGLSPSTTQYGTYVKDYILDTKENGVEHLIITDAYNLLVSYPPFYTNAVADLKRLFGSKYSVAMSEDDSIYFREWLTYIFKFWDTVNSSDFVIESEDQDILLSAYDKKNIPDFETLQSIAKHYYKITTLAAPKLKEKKRKGVRRNFYGDIAYTDLVINRQGPKKLEPKGNVWNRTRVVKESAKDYRVAIRNAMARATPFVTTSLSDLEGDLRFFEDAKVIVAEVREGKMYEWFKQYMLSQFSRKLYNQKFVRDLYKLDKKTIGGAYEAAEFILRKVATFVEAQKPVAKDLVESLLQIDNAKKAVLEIAARLGSNDATILFQRYANNLENKEEGLYNVMVAKLSGEDKATIEKIHKGEIRVYDKEEELDKLMLKLKTDLIVMSSRSRAYEGFVSEEQVDAVVQFAKAAFFTTSQLPEWMYFFQTKNTKNLQKEVAKLRNAELSGIKNILSVYNNIMKGSAYDAKTTPIIVAQLYENAKYIRNNISHKAGTVVKFSSAIATLKALVPTKNKIAKEVQRFPPANFDPNPDVKGPPVIINGFKEYLLYGDHSFRVYNVFKKIYRNAVRLYEGESKDLIMASFAEDSRDIQKFVQKYYFEEVASLHKKPAFATVLRKFPDLQYMGTTQPSTQEEGFPIFLEPYKRATLAQYFEGKDTFTKTDLQILNYLENPRKNKTAIVTYYPKYFEKAVSDKFALSKEAFAERYPYFKTKSDTLGEFMASLGERPEDFRILANPKNKLEERIYKAMLDFVAATKNDTGVTVDPLLKKHFPVFSQMTAQAISNLSNSDKSAILSKIKAERYVTIDSFIYDALDKGTFDYQAFARSQEPLERFGFMLKKLLIAAKEAKNLEGVKYKSKRSVLSIVRAMYALNNANKIFDVAAFKEAANKLTVKPSQPKSIFENEEYIKNGEYVPKSKKVSLQEVTDLILYNAQNNPMSSYVSQNFANTYAFSERLAPRKIDNVVEMLLHANNALLTARDNFANGVGKDDMGAYMAKSCEEQKILVVKCTTDDKYLTSHMMWFTSALSSLISESVVDRNPKFAYKEDLAQLRKIISAFGVNVK